MALLPLMMLGGCATPPHLGTAVKRQTAPLSAAGAALNGAARAHPLAFLDRIGWGADRAQLHQLQQKGAERVLDAQLRPDPHPVLPPQVAQRLATLRVNAPLVALMPPLVAEERAIRMAKRNASNDTDAQSVQTQLKALFRRMNSLTEQAMTEQLLLAIYSPDQLKQRLIWFWTNHFNVFRGGNIGPMMADYTQRVIAPHALGHFRALLQATMFSPQMLLYLNNAQNARGHINENYAREVMELHTVGLGAGYTQTDVTHLAHVLTGLGVNLADRPIRVRLALRDQLWRRGLVIFNPARHDPEPERVMGRVLQGRRLGEIEQVITLLADDPATAQHVSFELAQYFAASHPDPTMVKAMVRTWQRTDGDIAAVLHTLFTSPQFAASLSRPQLKDPMRYVVSAVRASFDGRVITNPLPLIGMLYRLGEPLYGRQTPDGYPLDSTAWDGPGQLVTRFEVAQQLAGGAPALFRPVPPALSAGAIPRTMLPPHRPPPQLSSSSVFLAAEPTLSRATLEALAQADNRVRWNALWLASPEFMTH